MIDADSSLEDTCFEIAGALDRRSIRAVLTGGSAATLYAPDAYTSMDAGFVLLDSPKRDDLREALAGIGFAQSDAVGTFEHPRTIFALDFPKGPLAVGGDYVHDTATLERDGIRLSILSPTDCVRDRLAHFYHWNDYTALAAAIGVTREHRENVDLAKVREWTERESSSGHHDHRPKFDQFLERLSNTPF